MYILWLTQVKGSRGGGEGRRSCTCVNNDRSSLVVVVFLYISVIFLPAVQVQTNEANKLVVVNPSVTTDGCWL